MRILTSNRCYLGDGKSILHLGILPDLCEDSDALLSLYTPIAATLEHAARICLKLELSNLISNPVYKGAPADKI